MKHILTILTAITLAATAIAQERITAYTFTYDETYIREIGKAQKKDRFMLAITPDGHSAFYSVNRREAERLTKEILEGAGDNVMAALPKIQSLPSGQDEEYYKNIPASGQITVTLNGRQTPLLYTETMLVPKWKQDNQTKVICGYNCTRATTHFHGRDWTVWFAPEIPISDGPWMLCGLPGLILEATDSENLFKFTCVGMEAAEIEPIAVPDRKYRKTDHSGFNKFVIKSYNDPLSTIDRGAGLKIMDVNGKEVTDKDLQRNCIFIEK